MRGYSGSFHGSFGTEQAFGEVSKECVQPPQGARRNRRGIRSDARESDSAACPSSRGGSATVAGFHSGADVSNYREVGPVVSAGTRNSRADWTQGGATARATLEGLRFQELPFHDFKHCLEGRT